MACSSFTDWVTASSTFLAATGALGAWWVSCRTLKVVRADVSAARAEARAVIEEARRANSLTECTTRLLYKGDADVCDVKTEAGWAWLNFEIRNPGGAPIEGVRVIGRWEAEGQPSKIEPIKELGRIPPGGKRAVSYTLPTGSLDWSRSRLTVFISYSTANTDGTCCKRFAIEGQSGPVPFLVKGGEHVAEVPEFVSSPPKAND